MPTINIGLVQMRCVADKATNIGVAQGHIRTLAAQGANIVVLPELFASLYFCDVEDHDNFGLAEPMPGPTTESMAALAKELGVVIVSSQFEKRAEGLYHNTCAVLDADGAYLGKYRKMHIPDDPGYYEKFYFTPGDTGYGVFNTKFGKLGVLVCWDQWYPEAARITSLMGADFLIYPTAIGWADHQTDTVNTDQYQAWQTIQRSHAVANGVPVISVNRTGVEGNMQFWGGSFITNAFGKVLWQGPHKDDALHVQAIDTKETDYYRTHWPFLRDRRIDSYGPILKRYID